jgi:hypothetical protein
MKNTQAFARIVIVGLGIYTCLRMIPIVMSSFFVLSHPTPFTLGMGFLHLVLMGGFLGGTAYILLYKSTALAAHLSSDLDPVPESPVAQWLPTALRLICMGAGFLYLSSFLTGLSHAIQLWIALQRRAGIQAGQAPVMTVNFIAWALLLPLAIYLLCGAPHFVRWQVHRMTGPS